MFLVAVGITIGRSVGTALASQYTASVAVLISIIRIFSAGNTNRTQDSSLKNDKVGWKRTVCAAIAGSRRQSEEVTGAFRAELGQDERLWTKQRQLPRKSFVSDARNERVLGPSICVVNAWTS